MLGGLSEGEWVDIYPYLPSGRIWLKVILMWGPSTNWKLYAAVQKLLDP